MEMLNESSVKKSVLSDIRRAKDFYNDTAEPIFLKRLQRYEADKDYYRERFPVLSEQSDFVSYDMWAFVQWAIPAIMNSFFNGGEAIAIVGRGGEDTHRAEGFKALIDFQVMTQNSGFTLMWDWFSDAFIFNLGAVKVTWKRDVENIRGRIEQVDPMKYMTLLQSGARIIQMGEPDPLSGEISFVEYEIPHVKENRPLIEPVYVTDLRWSPEARSIEEANFVAVRKLVSADHLKRNTVSRGGMYDDEAVSRAIENEQSGGLIFTEFEQRRNESLADMKVNDEDPARRLYELYECYTKIDIDGDDILDDVIVSVVGDEILRTERNPWEQVPIFVISPVRDTGKVIANMSFAEIVGELQDLKTAMMRQLIINTANTNNLRAFVDEEKIVLADLIEGRQHIRMRPGATDSGSPVIPFPQANIAPWSMPMLEYLEGIKEETTGQTRYNQGRDSKSLNKTATGISILTQASEQRIDYIVRVFAETGVGKMIRFLVRLNQMYMDRQQVIRLNNQPLEISPDDLKGEFDIDVNTDSGVGRRSQDIQNLQLYLAQIAPAGMQMGAITPANWATAAKKLLELSGIRNADEYVQDPAVIQQQMAMMMLRAAGTERGRQIGQEAAVGGAVQAISGAGNGSPGGA